MIESILKEIEELKKRTTRPLVTAGINMVLQIIEKYNKNNGWIPCSERLPEGENEKVIASVIWDGYEYATQSYFYHGKFYNKPYHQIPADKIQESYTGDMVIAWQPLPEVYHEQVD